ncbi:MAG: hypothetical protein WC640_03285 [Candidatus Paceibacterota bacterium]|jgi:RNA polymerase-binding transcription factor DksA
MANEGAPNLDSETRNYVDLLEKKLQEIEAAIVNDSDVSEPTVSDDAAESSEERAEQDSLIDNHRRERFEIIRAIKWLKEKGNVCYVCGGPIEKQRREVYLPAMTCLAHLREEIPEIISE